uniref:Cocaine- and amphetamine-regulated transcript protein n=1 Tax=Neolamprologus brichardi TaxID=32507 RepID=A0A3Q4HYU0_NEOBR
MWVLSQPYGVHFRTSSGLRKKLSGVKSQTKSHQVSGVRCQMSVLRCQVSKVRSVKENIFRRLPGLCRRLKRRRVTVLCNLEKFCWRGSQTSHSGQLCQCPRGSRCSHFFLHSL